MSNCCSFFKMLEKSTRSVEKKKIPDNEIYDSESLIKTEDHGSDLEGIWERDCISAVVTLIISLILFLLMYCMNTFLFCVIKIFPSCLLIASSQENGIQQQLIENSVENLDERIPMNDDSITKKNSGIYDNRFH